MAKHDNPTKYPAIDVEELYVGGVLIDPSGLGGKKMSKISPLKNGEADPATIGKKVNELIAALKLAGMMDNE